MTFLFDGQGVFFNLYTMFYLLSPKHCHAFVGYLEEEVLPLALLSQLSEFQEDRLNKIKHIMAWL